MSITCGWWLLQNAILQAGQSSFSTVTTCKSLGSGRETAASLKESTRKVPGLPPAISPTPPIPPLSALIAHGLVIVITVVAWVYRL